MSGLEDLSGDLALDAVSDEIYMLRRSGVGVNSVEVDVMIICPFIASKVALRMRDLQRHELVRLFKRYIALPSTRKTADDVFEAYCHVIFSKRIDFDFVPMVRIGGPKARRKKDRQWFSSHTKFRGLAAPELEVLRVSALVSSASLGIYPSRVVNYDSDEVAGGLHIEANVYYIPVRTDQVGISSFILRGSNLYLFQMTGSDTHGISDELSPFLASFLSSHPARFWLVPYHVLLNYGISTYIRRR